VNFSVMNNVIQKRDLEQVTRELITLQRISNALISTSYLDDVLKIIVEGLEKGLMYESGILFISDPKSKTLYPHLTHRNAFIQYMEELLGVNFSSLTISLSQKGNLLAGAIQEKKILTSELISEVFYGLSVKVPNDLGQKLTKKLGVRQYATVPMIVREEVAGVILCVTSRPVITKPEMESLTNFANQAGLAVDNAQIMNSLKRTQSELALKNERLNKAVIELQDLERLKNGLTDMVVHDMKNPLTAVRGYLELILETAEDKSSQGHVFSFIEKAYESSEDLLKMIHNLLDISRMEEGKFVLNSAECQIQDILKAVFSQQEIIAKNNQRNLILEPCQDIPPIKVDYDILHRVVGNLVSNAIKHTRRDGNIKIKISDDPDRGGILVCVEDDGEGIPPEFLNSIFEKFSQVRDKNWKNTHNVGLGLTFCKMAVENHQGKIWVESEVDKGSKFYFWLPKEQ